MNYSEKYEVRFISKDHPDGTVLAEFDSEHQAHEFMDVWMPARSGACHVVRVSEVTVGSVIKA